MITKAVNSEDMDKIPISLDYEERITELKTEVEQRDNIIFEITEKDYIIMKKDKALDESNSIIAEKEDEIRQLKKRIESLENGFGQ